MVGVAAPVDQLYPENTPPAPRVMACPSQVLLGPVMLGTGPKSGCTTATSTPWQPKMFVTVTEYPPGLVTKMTGVVAPVDQI